MQGLQTPPDTSNRAWRPSGVAQGLQTPPDTSNRVSRPLPKGDRPRGKGPRAVVQHSATEKGPHAPTCRDAGVSRPPYR